MERKDGELELTVTTTNLVFFTTLLQSGFELEVPGGTPLSSFLCSVPGFSAEYLADTVQTIFLDGTAVDDLHVPLRAHGDSSPVVVALSAAMPGLAGAIFRKNGPHGSLRTARLQEMDDLVEKQPVRVSLKLFNQIGREKGGDLLREGVLLGSASLADFFAKRKELLPRIEGARVDGVPVAVEELGRLAPVTSHVLLRVCVAGE